MAIQINKNTMIKDIAFWYFALAIVGLFLIFFRDDRKNIFQTIFIGYKKDPFIALIHTIGIFLLLPLSIPFSLGNILNKWL
jgi:hypothetical protein